MKVIFSDIDGTFFKQGIVPEVNIEAVKKLEAAGHRFVFVSGRGVQQIEQILTDCNFDCDYIYGNGAGYRLLGEKPVLEYYIDKADYDVWEQIFRDNKAFYYLHTNKGIIMQPLEQLMHHFDHLQEVYYHHYGDDALDLQKRKDYFQDTAIFAENPFQYLREHPEIKLIKFELLNGESEIRKTIGELATELGYFAFSSVLMNLEIVPPLSNKGNGIKRYLTKVAHAEKTYGFGDAMNDLEMFANVDVAIAMNDASDEVKRICNIVLEPEEEVGSYILEKIL